MFNCATFSAPASTYTLLLLHPQVRLKKAQNPSDNMLTELVYCWVTVGHGSPTMNYTRINVSC